MRDLLNTIHTADCNLFMSDLPEACIDLTVTSPPYDKLRVYNGFSFDVDLVIKNLYRITKKGGIVVWVVSDQTVKGSESGTSFRTALKFMEIGFNLHDTMIYAKKNFIPQTHNRYEQEFEYMFVFSKGKPNTFSPLKVPAKTAGQTMKLGQKGYGFKEGSFRRRHEEITTGENKTPGNIFYYACGSSGKNHPAVFPAALAADHIKTWTNPLDIVFDPFSGSGTTCEEAKRLSRWHLGCDISAQYVKESNESLANIDSIFDIL